MSRFYRVRINDLYLTSDGTNAGTPCKLTISNLEDLLTSFTGSTAPAASGELIPQIVPWTAGKQFEIKIDSINSAQFETLKGLITGSLDDDPLTVIGTGAIGNFTVSARPSPSKPYQAERFLNGRIYGVSIRLYTV